MNELKVLNVDSDNQTVSARELHERLKIGTRFNDWFPRMCEYGFTENEDFYSKMSKTTNGGRPSTDYEINIDMAKQICMIQRTPEGKALRQYLIDLEKAWNTPEQVMARALKVADKTICDLNAKISNQQLRIEEMKPKEIFADAVSCSNTSILVGELAKLLKQNGVDIGQNRLFDWLRSNGYLTKSNIPTQKSMELKLFEIHERTINNPDGSIRITRTTKVTGKGQMYFINKFLKTEEGDA